MAKESWREWLKVPNGGGGTGGDIDLSDYATKDDLALKADKANTVTSNVSEQTQNGKKIRTITNDAKALDYLYVPGNSSYNPNNLTETLRDIPTKPSDYIVNGTNKDFGGKFKLSGLKKTASIGLENSGTSLATVLGLTGWKDTSGNGIPVHELAFAKNGLYRRQGGNIKNDNTIIDDTFGSWKQLIDSDNIGTYIDKHIKVAKAELVVTEH
jgi:hypothetical protein